MSRSSRPDTRDLKAAVWESLDAWPGREAKRRLTALCATDDLDRLNHLGYALARCGRARRTAADEFLSDFESDRRLGVRTAVLYARAYLYDDDPRAFVREMGRVASLPGRRPWVAIMDELYWMWGRAPRDMFRLITPWLAHRDPWRRWAALHGLEVPARTDPRSTLKVLRVLRGERHLRVRRLLGHVLCQSLYLSHPEVALDEMARWLNDGASAARPVTRQIERQVELWFGSGHGSSRQKRGLLRAVRDYAGHSDPSVRAHARRLERILAG